MTTFSKIHLQGIVQSVNNNEISVKVEENYNGESFINFFNVIVSDNASKSCTIGELIEVKGVLKRRMTSNGCTYDVIAKDVWQ